MPEFVKVVYQEDRAVNIDGDPSGRVGDVLRVQKGRHTFNMGAPRDYKPKWRRPMVEGTNPLRPMKVTFEPK